MAKDYYAILGVMPSATQEEIRSAYRSRAKQFHPDRFGKDSAPFLRIQEAYDVLSDPENRRLYDQTLKRKRAESMHALRPEPLTRPVGRRVVETLRGGGIMDLGIVAPMESFRAFRPSFDEIFDTLWNAFEPQPKSEKFRTLTMEIPLTWDQARWGGRLQVYVPVDRLCPECGGAGRLNYFLCRFCGGRGTVREELPLEVELPPGIPDRFEVAVPLNRYGIRDVRPVLLFRVGSTGDIEDL